ncbi:hypothetical protein COB21_05645 [Candidatus Aerophobetes bacterium]|uniref:Uncharacterized protein n=1 Tax=Aerophobetes bacterium TaxID=2030807 RepID=A0A2A4WYY2_UNCAE|nr:MAG: hypothetical protein COB21_05645 [Candidatus Aerophobetes bacterium]
MSLVTLQPANMSVGVYPLAESWQVPGDNFTRELFDRVWDIAQSAIVYFGSRLPSFSFPVAGATSTETEGVFGNVTNFSVSRLDVDAAVYFTDFLWYQVDEEELYFLEDGIVSSIVRELESYCAKYDEHKQVMVKEIFNQGLSIDRDLLKAVLNESVNHLTQFNRMNEILETVKRHIVNADHVGIEAKLKRLEELLSQEDSEKMSDPKLRKIVLLNALEMGDFLAWARTLHAVSRDDECGLTGGMRGFVYHLIESKFTIWKEKQEMILNRESPSSSQERKTIFEDDDGISIPLIEISNILDELNSCSVNIEPSNYYTGSE